MSIGGGSTEGTQQSSSTRPQLFKPKKILLPEQLSTISKISPMLLEGALGKGLSSAERSRMMTRMSEDINRPAQAAMGNLRNIYGQSGVRGGVQRGDISDIFEAKIGATGEASRSIEEMSRMQKNEKWKRLLQFAMWSPPFAVGSSSDSSSSGGGGWDANFGFAPLPKGKP